MAFISHGKVVCVHPLAERILQWKGARGRRKHYVADSAYQRERVGCSLSLLLWGSEKHKKPNKIFTTSTRTKSHDQEVLQWSQVKSFFFFPYFLHGSPVGDA